MAVFDRVGTVERLDVADMHEQEEQRAARLAAGASVRPAVAVVRCGVVAVAAGAGMRRLYEQLGAHVVEGGSTLNPSTFEILAGIHEVAADEVVVLPNSAQRDPRRRTRRGAVREGRRRGRVALAAGRARCASSSTTPTAGWRRTCSGCAARSTGSRTGAVAPAARDDKQGRFAQGDAVGFVDEEMVAWGDAARRRCGPCSEALAEGRELLTCVGGDGAPLDDDGDRARSPPPAWRSNATTAASRTTGG